MAQHDENTDNKTRTSMTAIRVGRIMYAYNSSMYIILAIVIRPIRIIIIYYNNNNNNMTQAYSSPSIKTTFRHEECAQSYAHNDPSANE